MDRALSLVSLKTLLLQQDPTFWAALAERSASVTAFDEVLFLSRLRRQAPTRGLPPPAGKPLRVAVLGGSSLYPLHEVMEHMLATSGFEPSVFVGEYDNYQAEIREPESGLYAHRPDVTFLLPSQSRCRYDGNLSDPEEKPRAAAEQHVRELLDLCAMIQKGTGGDVILANFLPPATLDPGPFRSKSLAAASTFKRFVNLELGLRAPSYVHVCDVDFLASRRGHLAAHDERARLETKQLGSPDLLLDVAREIAHIARSLRGATSKVLALDLDNTLWGGVIGDDGLEGIEIGDTSPRGEAFKDLQKHLLSLARRGVLLAVCSKNERAAAVLPFEKHPEMVLRMEHFAAFYANWEPKSENLRAIARDLNVGLDSLVFVDDNPAEIEIVRQFVPEVRTILLGPDPAEYARKVADCRFFEPLAITAEDLQRGEQYRQEQSRRALLASVTDMDAYLSSLEMEAKLKPFTPVDATRITQLVNKSNQFNVTTIRRSEAEVQRLLDDPARPSFVVRLADRFGDHGLISVVICEVVERDGARDLLIDTWVMSCRVLKRQVEEEVDREIFRIAREKKCARVIGRYVRTAKNDLVRDLFPRLGYTPLSEDGAETVYARDVTSHTPVETKIRVLREES